MCLNFIKLTSVVLGIGGGFIITIFDIVQYLLFIVWFYTKQLFSLIVEPNFGFMQPFYSVLSIITHLSVE